ncbi:MAG: phytanoyl-CoA dioxygenase family protein [Cyclobacteriaceae bacterium]
MPRNLTNMQWFNKPPKIGKETPPHQDGYYFMLDPSEAVTMWLVLEDVDEENGCVRYIPGFHQEGLRAHGGTGVFSFSQGIINYEQKDKLKEIPMLVGAGDLLVHPSMTIYRANANTGTRTRMGMGLGLIYYSSVARENKEKQALKNALGHTSFFKWASQ